MQRVNTSPAQNLPTGMADSMDKLTFYACTNTMDYTTKAEGKRPVVVDQAAQVQASLAEIIELQRLG
jgi:intracellular sulfur oxidation DsrE/DsrF family protein|tara:strand:- start:282 stop:482 length:201 start_codon:yes stop_codon:yes gene_type:complete